MRYAVFDDSEKRTTTSSVIIRIRRKFSDTPDTEDRLKVPCFQMPVSGQCSYLMNIIFWIEYVRIGNITGRQLTIDQMRHLIVILIF